MNNNFLNQIELAGYLNEMNVSKKTTMEEIKNNEDRRILIKFNLTDDDLISIFNKKSLFIGDVFFNIRNNKFYFIHLANLSENKGMFYGFSLYLLHDVTSIDYTNHSETHNEVTEIDYIFKNDLELMIFSKKVDKFKYMGNLYKSFNSVFNNISYYTESNQSSVNYFLNINLPIIKDKTFEKLNDLNILIQTDEYSFDNYRFNRLIQDENMFKMVVIDKAYIDYSLYSYIQEYYLTISDLLIKATTENQLEFFFLGLNKKGCIDFFNKREPNGCLLSRGTVAYENIYNTVGRVIDYKLISLFDLEKDNGIKYKKKYKEFLLDYIS